MRARLLFLVPAVVYTGLIFYLSLINLADTPVKDLGVSDKILHAGAYFILGLLWIFFVIFNYEKSILFRGILIVVAAAIAFGILIEVLQTSLTTYRQMDLYDIFANSAGAVVAGVIAWLTKESLIKVKGGINSFFIKK